MTEFPVTTIPIKRYKKYLSWNKIRSILQNTSSAKSALDSKLDVKENGNEVKKSKLQYLRETEYQTWDFCLFSKAMHRYFIKQADELGLETVTLIGHPKSLTSTRGLKYVIRILNNNEFEFNTLRII